MDIFRFTNPESSISMEQGIIVNGLISKMWIERYREAGEFEITGTIDKGIQTNLPIGTYISHVDSDQVMIVENHELTDDGKSDPIVKVTGRSFETMLERRVVGSQRVFPTTNAVPNFVLEAAPAWEQAETLIAETAMWINTNLHVYSDLRHWETGYLPEVSRVIPRGPAYPELIKLLAVNNFGIRAIRPNRAPEGFSFMSGTMTFIIHDGKDRTDTVLFSQSSGEIEQADYLWSDKKHMNYAYISGKWVDAFVGPTDIIGIQGTDADVRMMYVDGNDIDQDQPAYPTGDALLWIRAAMEIRGKQALASQRRIILSKVEMAKEPTGAVYRKDYNLGDHVSVDGNYGISGSVPKMRVTEYVEIEDEEGTRGYPTLEYDEEEAYEDDDPDPPPDPDITPPGEVTDLDGTPSSTSIALSWVNPIDSDFIGVVICRTLGFDPATSHTDGVAVADLTGGETMYTDTGLDPSTRYCYVIFAYDSEANFAAGLSSISIMTTS